MKRQQTFKYELMPTGERQRKMRRFAGSYRFVYSKALALQKERYERGEKKLGYAGVCRAVQTAYRVAQQALSRKTKFSNNWKKAKARVQRIHARIGNVRRDYLHKTSTAISKNHAMLCIEDLQVRNMSKSADNRRAQAQFLCVECGFEENADVVGAINILRAGHARFACEVSGAAMPPAAGTHRSDSGTARCRS